MKVTFFGTTTLLFDDGKDQIFFDAHMTRPSLMKYISSSSESTDKQVVDEKLKLHHVDRLKAIFVSHSHHDHVMDAPYIANQCNAVIYGASSTMNVARGGDVPEDRLVEFAANETYEVGNYRIKVIPSIHSKPTALNNDLGQTIDKPLRQPAQEQKEPAERALHIKMSTLRKTAAIAAAIALLVMLAIPVGNSTRQFLDTCKIDKSWFYRIMPKEITSNKPVTVNTKAATPKPAAPVKDETKQPVVEEKVQEPATYWTIVLASQVSKKNAELFAASLQKRGYAEATVVLRRNGNKVVMGRFSSETEAQNRVRTLRQESADFAEAWVMKMQEP